MKSKPTRMGILGMPSKMWSDDDSHSSDSDYVPPDDDHPTNNVRTPKPSIAESSKSTASVSKRKQPIVVNKDAVKSSTTGNGSHNGLGTLPTELLIKIFRQVASIDGAIPFVPRASRVCTVWRSILQDIPDLWSYVYLPVGWSRSADLIVDRLAHRVGGTLQKLNLSGIGSVTDATVLSLSQHCPNLKSLILRRCTLITHKHLAQLAACPLLEVVDISHTHVTAHSANTVLKRFVATHPHLRILKVAGCRALNDGVVLAISEHLHELEELDLSSTGVFNFDIDAFQNGCPKLRTLTLRGCKLVLSRKATRSDVGFRSLRSLDLSCVHESMSLQFIEDNFHLGDDGVSGLCRGADQLEELDLCGIRSLTPNLFTRLTSEKLKVLRVSRSGCCARDGVVQIAKKWGHSLMELNVSWNSSVNDTVLKSIADYSPLMLENINLSGTEVTSEGVYSMLQKCLLIKELDLSSCRGVIRGYKRRYSCEEIQDIRKRGYPMAKNE